MTKKIPSAAILFVIGIGVAGFVGYAATKEAYRSKKIEKEIESLKQEAERIKKENSALEEKIAYFETPGFQERVGKEKLNLQKPDEKVVVVKPETANGEADAAGGTAAIQESEEQLPNYIKWWEYFFKY